MDRIPALPAVDKCLTETASATENSVSEVVAATEQRVPHLRDTLRGAYQEGNLRVGGANLRPRWYASSAGFEQIPIISLGPKPWKNLSPFFLGPVGDAANVENYWQFHKVWATVDRQRQIKRPKNKPERVIWVWPAERHVDEKNEVVPAYWKWRAAGFANEEAVRRPNGRHVPVYSLFRGEKLGLAEARRQIYVPAYRAAASKTSEFARLLAKLRAGEKIMLIDLDGPRWDAHPEGVSASPDLLHAWIAKEHDEKGRYFSYGHGYVLALLLLEHLGVA